LINPDKIDEWIQEVEQRPSSAALIIQYIANRLRDLTSRNEELLAENIGLRSGRKVEEYESRIANLEYQLEILKRQIGGEINLMTPAAVEGLSIIAYQVDGKVLRFEVAFRDLASGEILAQIPPENFTEYLHPRLVITSPVEELLFVFDSGRTVNMAVADVPVITAGKASWTSAMLVEPRGGEELAAVLPIARMSLFDFCVQVSRRGYVKKMMRPSFESHVAKNFIGTGVKQKPDRTAGLTFCMKDDLFVLSSREGWLTCQGANEMSYTAEDTLKLSATDHIVSGFSMAKKKSFAVITQNGKVIIREAAWLEKPVSAKGRGQPIFSPARREAGVRVIGAAAVDENDWGAALCSDGCVTAHRLSDLIAAGSLGESSSEKTYLEFVLFNAAVPN